MNIQQPIDCKNESHVLKWKSHSCEDDGHGHESGLRDPGGTNGGGC